ncbi:MAG TPA: Ig-like domain-containing protein [Acidimicrobiales bacterium]|nr:Ig-like domain-containing protein [Acidimicrobiales bacterium]
MARFAVLHRYAALTSVLVLALTAVLTTTGPASATPVRAGSAGAAAGHGARVIKQPKVKVPRAKAGTTWTLKIGDTCESDSFAGHHRFTDVAVKGDTGTYKGKKIVTMTWTAGANTGAVFKGTFVKADDDYVGPFVNGNQTQSATLVPGATYACDVLTSAPQSNAIVFGNSDFDTATVGGQNSITPTGSVHFYVCPGDSDPCTPTSDGVVDLGTAALVGLGNSANAFSPAYTPPATGSYCFLGAYSGDSHYDPVSDGSTTDECFIVTAQTPILTTYPADSSIATNINTHDMAVVTGTANVTPTGTVTFFVCGPTQSPVACATGSQIGSPAAVVSGQSLSEGLASSANFTTSSPGFYCYRAVYSGDGNYASASDSSTNECFQITNGSGPT